MNPLALDPTRFLVADDDDDGATATASTAAPALAACGQVVALESPSQASSHEIRSLVVAEGRRGSGLGSALLAALLESLPPDADSVWLTTLAKRAPFYERAGFEVVAGDGSSVAAASLLGGLLMGGGRDVGSSTSTSTAPPPPIPPAMRFEVLAGSVVGPLLGGDRLVVMCRRRRQGE